MEHFLINTKDDRQKLGTYRFAQANGIGIFDYVPRFGKTISALKAASSILRFASAKTVLVIAHSEFLKKQWEIEVNTYNTTCVYEDVLRDITVVTINETIKKQVDESFGLIIYDEIHKYLTENRLFLLTSLNSKFKLGLTGSMPTDPDDRNKLISILPICDTISEQEAIRNSWIAPYVEYNLPISFNFDEQKKYIIYSNHIAETLNNYKGIAEQINRLVFNLTIRDVLTEVQFKFNDDFDVILACNNGYFHPILKHYFKNDFICRIVSFAKGYNKDLDLSNSYNKLISDTFNPTTIQETTYKFKTYIDNRNNIINNGETKLNAILDIIFKAKDKNIIVFVGSIKAADLLNTVINTNLGNNYSQVYHSKLESKFMFDENNNIICHKNGKPKKFGSKGLKDLIVSYIDRGITKVLIGVKSLDEGINIPRLNLCINASGSTNNIEQIQRTARVKTINIDNKFEIVNIVNVFYDDFYPDEKFVNLVKDINSKQSSRDKTKLLLRQKGLVQPVLIQSIQDLEF